MPSEARQKKIVEKLNRAQKCSILGPQNLGSGGGPGPRPPPLDPHLSILVCTVFDYCLSVIHINSILYAPICNPKSNTEGVGWERNGFNTVN